MMATFQHKVDLVNAILNAEFGTVSYANTDANSRRIELMQLNTSTLLMILGDKNAG